MLLASVGMAPESRRMKKAQLWSQTRMPIEAQTLTAVGLEHINQPRPEFSPTWEHLVYFVYGITRRIKLLEPHQRTHSIE